MRKILVASLLALSLVACDWSIIEDAIVVRKEFTVTEEPDRTIIQRRLYLLIEGESELHHCHVSEDFFLSATKGQHLKVELHYGGAGKPDVCFEDLPTEEAR